jgi:hypothetical protein
MQEKTSGDERRIWGSGERRWTWKSTGLGLMYEVWGCDLEY